MRVQTRQPHTRRDQCKTGDRNDNRDTDDKEGELERRKFVEPVHATTSQLEKPPGPFGVNRQASERLDGWGDTSLIVSSTFVRPDRKKGRCADRPQSLTRIGSGAISL
jgi:hypothetical protein